VSNTDGLSSLTVTKIPYLNTIVIKKRGRPFFISTKDSIVIDIFGLAFIIKFLVMNNLISYRILEGILDEYNSSRET
jgi:hypothetical protein